MENAAYSKEYMAYRHEQETVFCSDNLEHQDTSVLSPHYQRIRRSYRGKAGEYTVHATENELHNKEGMPLYLWRNLDDDGEFCKIIKHKDGNSYMIFRRDLYGYSILNLATMQDYHYIPSASFPQGETFIWTDVHYNKENNMLAVSGCYWACPAGTLLLDFTHPMNSSGIWTEVEKHMDDGYAPYDDVDFCEWRGTNLILNAYNIQTKQKELLSIAEDEYRKWF